MTAEVRTRIPNFADIREAVRTYYEKTYIGTADITRLFRCAPETARRLKILGQKKEIENQTMLYNAGKVNVKWAYEAWGYDIADLERRVQKLKRLGFEP